MEGMGITSDVMFAIMPMFFIWPLDRPVMERILISILMVLGIVAAIVGGIKVYYIKVQNPNKDLRNQMPLFWWYRVKEIGLIVAACAPFLKHLIGRMLGRFGVKQFKPLIRDLNSFRSGPADAEMGVNAGSFTQQTNGMQQLTLQNPSQGGPRHPRRPLISLSLR